MTTPAAAAGAGGADDDDDVDPLTQAMSMLDSLGGADLDGADGDDGGFEDFAIDSDDDEGGGDDLLDLDLNFDAAGDGVAANGSGGEGPEGKLSSEIGALRDNLQGRQAAPPPQQQQQQQQTAAPASAIAPAATAAQAAAAAAAPPPASPAKQASAHSISHPLQDMGGVPAATTASPPKVQAGVRQHQQPVPSGQGERLSLLSFFFGMVFLS